MHHNDIIFIGDSTADSRSDFGSLTSDPKPDISAEPSPFLIIYAPLPPIPINLEGSVNKFIDPTKPVWEDGWSQ